MPVWLVSNGAGEDRCGATIGRALGACLPDASLSAAPIVGSGEAYRSREIPVMARGVRLRSGGFSTAGIQAFVRDIPAAHGYLRWAAALRSKVAPSDRVLVVGDVFAVVAARLAARRADAFVSLAKSNRHVRHTALETRFLARVPDVFTRDPETAAALAEAGVHARYAGNPMMDDLDPSPGPALHSPGIALLPGTRPESPANAGILIGIVDVLPGDTRCVLAVTASFDRDRFLAIAARRGWTVVEAGGAAAKGGGAVAKGGRVVGIEVDRFANVIHASKLAIGMAGTAIEQAAGLGRVVVTCRGTGPQSSAKRMREQERLLGGAAIFVDGPAGKVAAEVRRLLDEPGEMARRADEGRRRMGDAGASSRIAGLLAASWRGQH